MLGTQVLAIPHAHGRIVPSDVQDSTGSGPSCETVAGNLTLQSVGKKEVEVNREGERK